MKNSALPNNRRVKSLTPTPSGESAQLYRWERGELDLNTTHFVLLNFKRKDEE